MQFGADPSLQFCYTTLSHMKEDGSFTFHLCQNLKSQFTLRHETVCSLHGDARAIVSAAATYDAILKEGFHAGVRPILINRRQHIPASRLQGVGLSGITSSLCSLTNFADHLPKIVLFRGTAGVEKHHFYKKKNIFKILETYNTVRDFRLPLRSS
jgi:hypothetical protein